MDAPSFAKDREEFGRLFGSDENAKQFLSSPDAVTKALRDYVWSLGTNGGTAPVEPKTPAQAQSAFGAAPQRAAGGR